MDIYSYGRLGLWIVVVGCLLGGISARAAKKEGRSMLPQPPQGYLSSKDVVTALERFVRDPLQKLPKRAQPSDVAAWLQASWSPTEDGTRDVLRAAELLDFFALDVDLKPLLTLTEVRPDDDLGAWQRAQYALRVLGTRVGENVDLAGQYETLVRHPQASGREAMIIDSLFYLPGVSSAGLRTLLRARLETLKPKVDTDDDVAVAYYALEDLLADRLPTIEALRARARTIGAEGDTKRHEGWMRMYLGLDKSPFVDLQRFGAMMLQRECRQASPDVLARAFETALQKLMKEAKSRQMGNELAAAVTRAGRAVTFYGGQLDSKRRAFFDRHIRATQPDLLYWND